MNEQWEFLGAEKNGIRLTGAVPGDDCSWGLQQNLQIEPGRTGARIAQIQANHVVKSYPAAPLHLPEARNSGLRLEQTTSVPSSICLDLIRYRRARTDQ